VAGSAIGHTLRSAPHSQSVIAVGERRDAIGREVVAERKALVAVASATRCHRDARGVHQGPRFFGSEDEMLAVAVAAYRSAGEAIFHGLSMHAFVIGFGDLSVALAAGGRNIPVVDLRTGVPRGQNAMAAVAIGAGCGSAIAVHDGPSMNALLVEFDGMRKRNFMPR